ncbi:PiggyBac transposable element-derived protein 3, partial [Danaus plexippus plexippus]
MLKNCNSLRDQF